MTKILSFYYLYLLLTIEQIQILIIKIKTLQIFVLCCFYCTVDKLKVKMFITPSQCI